jgi:cyclic pyranopterin phosphate synthase
MALARRSLPIATTTTSSSESRIALPEAAPPRPRGWGEAGARLVDGQGRSITYLRASITDRCGMACVYCMPLGGEDEHATRTDALEPEELTAIARALAGAGVRRIRLTGGEPLVRKDAVRIVALLRERSGARELAMTTNGARLAELARPLRDAGLEAVNVSIDSLDRARFAEITRGGELDSVLAGIRAAIDVGLEVKINCVALGGVNDHELGAIVDWAWSLGIVPRFIELMPIGEGATLPRERFLAARDIVARLGDRVVDASLAAQPDRGPARYLPASDRSGRRVGLITAVSDEFCGGCNRVRLTSRGELRACLASRRAVSLRDLVRAGASDLDVVWAASWSLGGKLDGHLFADAAQHEHERVGMSLIGG